MQYRNYAHMQQKSTLFYCAPEVRRVQNVYKYPCNVYVCPCLCVTVRSTVLISQVIQHDMPRINEIVPITTDHKQGIYEAHYCSQIRLK